MSEREDMLSIVAVLDSANRTNFAFPTVFWFQNRPVAVVIFALLKVVCLFVLIIVLHIVTLVALKNEARCVFLAVVVQQRQ